VAQQSSLSKPLETNSINLNHTLRSASCLRKAEAPMVQRGVHPSSNARGQVFSGLYSTTFRARHDNIVLSLKIFQFSILSILEPFALTYFLFVHVEYRNEEQRKTEVLMLPLFEEPQEVTLKELQRSFGDQAAISLDVVASEEKRIKPAFC
jgi:hypothetical protein